MSNYKTCTKCKKSLDKSLFQKLSSSPDGLNYQCKQCLNAYKKQWAYSDKSRVQKNAEKRRQWYQRNKSRLLEKSAKRYAENTGYWSNHYLQNKEHKLQYAKKWKQANKPKTYEAERRRRARLKGNGSYYVSPKEIAKLLSCQCFYCGSTTDITLDHVIPIVRGGTHSIGNLLPACRSCNSRKSGRGIMEFRLNKKAYSTDKNKK